MEEICGYTKKLCIVHIKWGAELNICFTKMNGLPLIFESTLYKKNSEMFPKAQKGTYLSLLDANIFRVSANLLHVIK